MSIAFHKFWLTIKALYILSELCYNNYIYAKERTMILIYLDNAATTAPCREAIDAVNKGLEVFGNPSSLHRLGLDAELLVTTARETIAESIGAESSEIYFTSGATESSNTAIFGAFRAHGKRKNKLIISSVEHPATANPALQLEEQGCEVVRISPRADGRFYAEDFINAADENTFLISVMYVNNETGYILPVQEIFSGIKKKYPQILTHCDCVQGYMKLPVKVKKLGADMLSLSGHKIHGPKGVGALYVRRGIRFHPFVIGGHQENGRRAGTENVASLVGLGAAAELAKAKTEASQQYEQIIADANAKSEEMIAQARLKTKEAADQEKIKAQNEMAALIDQAAKKVVGQKSDADLYDDFIKEMDEG